MKLSGIIVAPVTPMSDDGKNIATKAVFQSYYKFLIDRKVSGMLVAGTTGEGFLMSLEERKKVAEYALGYAAHNLPVIIHVGSNTTADSIELAVHAQSLKAEGVTLVTPSFYSYDLPALLSHFQAVANAVPNTPVYLYNLPSFTHNDVLPELVVEMQRSCPNVVGIKHSDADMIRLQEYRRLAGPGFCLLSGDDAMEYGALALGADGCVSGKSSSFPEITVALFRAFNSGDLATARHQQIKIDLLATVLDLGVGIGLAYFKAALRWRGLNVGGLRPPQRWLTPDEESAMRKGLDGLQKQGVLDDLQPV